jgi:DNA-binding helix-hairpin-helix protein with protein kinase domain/Flp pilus assembly protein TadD
MANRLNSQLYDSQGRLVVLDRELRRGGEGVVYEVKGQGDRVAKLYHQAIHPEKAAKLSAMVALRTERLLKLTAWPVETLHKERGGTVKGFLMPKVLNHKEIHVLYGVKSRLHEYPQARWPFLIQTAANVARAFSVIHEHGQVIGDVNHGGIFVSNEATVVLVDCDSFQVVSQGRQFLCEVGVDTHTPPELQGKSFREILRSPNHDAFGLAVIIFQLLFMGRHPFSGRYLGAGDIPLDRAIRERRFAYGLSARANQMLQPPGTLSLDAASSPVANLFERAFVQSNRPTACEWVTALSQLGQNLRLCVHNDGHSYLKALKACPWCEAESQLGVVLFNVVVRAGAGHTTFNITAVWARISSVKPPDPLPSLTSKSSFIPKPSQEVMQLRRGRLIRALISVGVIALATLLVVIAVSSGIVAFGVVFSVGIGAAVMNRVKGKASKAQEDVERIKKEAEQIWRDVEQRWRGQLSSEPFHAKFRELEAKKISYEDLPAMRQRKLRKLHDERLDRQKLHFLDKFNISDAKINGIGPSRKMTLYSFGVETAADVTQLALSRVPGFGPTFKSKLVNWRRDLETRFVLDPTQGVDSADIQAVEQEIVTARSRLERELQNGSVELQRVGQQIQAKRMGLICTADQSARTLAQAEADWKSLPRIAPLVYIWIVIGFAILVVLPLRYAWGSSNSSDRRATGVPISIDSENSAVGRRELSPHQRAARATEFYDQGLKFTKAKNYAEAAKMYQQAVALNPDMAEAQLELGYALLRIGKYQDSVAASEKAISLNPQTPKAYRDLGQAYSALANWRAALTAFQGAIKLTPNDATTYYDLGGVLRRLQENAQALEAYQKALSIKPDYAAAHYELGILYVETGDRASAIDEYTVLDSLNPKLAEKLYAEIARREIDSEPANANVGGTVSPL